METVSHIFAITDPECPACGGNEWRSAGQAKDYTVTGEWFELRECTTCHLMTTYPQPSESQIGKYYASTEYISHTDTQRGLTNKLYHKARNFMMKKKWQWVTDASSKTSGNLLDVGAGTGHFAKFMQDHGWTITALEPDSTARQVALQKLKLQIDPLESLLTMTGEVFDVITLWHVLEHVHDVKGYLEKFRQILKPDGILLIAVPNHTSRDARHYGSKWAALDVPRHLWHFSPDSMKRLLHTQGFVLQKKITMPLDGFYVSMLSEKYKRNNWMGPVAAIVSGLKTINASKRNVDRASSLIYISRKKK